MKKPDLIYFICTTPRTGSELLCEFLRGTKIAGWPEEYFQETHFQFLFNQFEASNFPEYFSKLIPARTTHNGIFAAKIMGGGYFDQTIARFRELPGYENPNITPAEIMNSLFPQAKYIWLTRRNKVRQAISYSRAFQSNIWQTHVEAGRQHGRDPVFNYEAIDNLLQRLVLHETAWQEFFNQVGITPYPVVYEDYAQQPIQQTYQIMQYLGIQTPPGWMALEEFTPRPQKLADKESDDWFEEYVRLKRSEINRLRESHPEAIFHTEYNGLLRQEQFTILRKAEAQPIPTGEKGGSQPTSGTSGADKTRLSRLIPQLIRNIGQRIGSGKEY